MATKKTKTPKDWNEWIPGSGQIKGGQHNLDKPIPPMRHGQTGYPMIDRDRVDWKRVIEEQNRRDGI